VVISFCLFHLVGVNEFLDFLLFDVDAAAADTRKNLSGKRSFFTLVFLALLLIVGT